jgi:type IV secretion system protein VirB10
MTDAVGDDTFTPRPAAEPAPKAFERSISPIAGRLGPGLAGKGVVLAALVAGCGVFVAATWRGDHHKTSHQPVQPAQQVVPFEPLKADAPPTLAAPGPGAPTLAPTSATLGQVPALQPGPNGGGPAGGASDPAAQKRAEIASIRGAPLLAYSQNGARTVEAEAAPFAVPAIRTSVAEGATELDQLRRGSVIGQARATRLPNRNFLIVAGTAIPCTLQTAMDTSTPGYVNCLIPRDVLSDNGAVVLMEKGTKVLGEYHSGIRQGQKRLFVLWTRAVTPAGVAISLASPAADALGRAGFDGDIDTHFWERFGGALLLSIVDDGTSALAVNNGGSATVRLPSDAAGIALQNSINIPPSLRKPQGSEVSIFFAQDFDFSGVYGLKAR